MEYYTQMIIYVIFFMIILIFLIIVYAVYQSKELVPGKLTTFYCASGECVVNIFTGNKICDFSKNMIYNPEIETCSLPNVCTGTNKYAVDSFNNAVSSTCEKNTNCNCLLTGKCNSDLFSDVFISKGNTLHVSVNNNNEENNIKCFISKHEFENTFNGDRNICSVGGTLSVIQDTNNVACIKQVNTCSDIPIFDKNTLKLVCLSQ